MSIKDELNVKQCEQTWAQIIIDQKKEIQRLESQLEVAKDALKTLDYHQRDDRIHDSFKVITIALKKIEELETKAQRSEG